MEEELQLCGLHKDGHEFPVDVSLSPLETDEGVLVSSSIRDITERRVAEKKIWELNRKTARQNMELTTINRELESFTYSVSHDLRAPLRAIDGFSMALLEDCGHKLESHEKEHLRRVRAATAHMGRLIDGLLNLARTSRHQLVRGKVDMSAVAREVACQLQVAEPDRMVTFVIATGLIVQGDPILLRVMLENLLSNAWKFTSKRSEARIEFGARSEGRDIVYFVCDDGVGFDMKYVSKLFGAFQRLHDASEFPGTGIGLASVQRIVSRHGGRIWAEGTVGKGATFCFVLSSETPALRSLDMCDEKEVFSQSSGVGESRE
jgi:light-regulated signal transduction histidine kinase (bacteriophytochrome)